MAVYELETVDALPVRFKAHAPPLSARQQLVVRSIARVCVIVNGADYIAPWVQVVEVKRNGRYVGEVGGIANSPDWLEYGSRVEFGPENVVEI